MSEDTEESSGDGSMSASEYFRTPDEAMRYLFNTDLALSLLQADLEVLSIKHRNCWDWVYKITASVPEDPTEDYIAKLEEIVKNGEKLDSMYAPKVMKYKFVVSRRQTAREFLEYHGKLSQHWPNPPDEWGSPSGFDTDAPLVEPYAPKTTGG